MHPIFQSFKRCYWASMRFSREWMAYDYARHGITPARLDMLIVIARDPGGIGQNVLREVLDVCAPVVSRMLESLEDLGHVVRSPHPDDRRVNLVELTEHGAKVLDDIVTRLLYEGTIEHMVRMILSRHPEDDAHTERVLTRTRRILRHLRTRIVDRSTLVYPAYLPNGERSPDHPYRRRDHVYDPAYRPRLAPPAAPPPP